MNYYDTITMSRMVAGQVSLLWRDKQCCIWYLGSHQYRCKLNTGSTDGTGADTPCYGYTERDQNKCVFLPASPAPHLCRYSFLHRSIRCRKSGRSGRSPCYRSPRLMCSCRSACKLTGSRAPRDRSGETPRVRYVALASCSLGSYRN